MTNLTTSVLTLWEGLQARLLCYTPGLKAFPRKSGATLVLLASTLAFAAATAQARALKQASLSGSHFCEA